MINPKQITNFNRTEAELQEFLLFCIVVAGKNSHQQAIKLDNFLKGIGEYPLMENASPFNKITFASQHQTLLTRLKQAKLGQYDRIYKAFIEVAARFNSLKSVTVDKLETVHGIGPKTARFFVMHSRPNQRVATLDTHILRWMRDIGIEAPKATPSGKSYLELEEIFLDLCDYLGKTPAALDLEIWKESAKAS